jgi:Peptidase_C39 like family
MIDLTIHTQPDDESCGPTSLHAIYRYYGWDINLNEVISKVERSHSGGTLTPMLGKHALQHNFDALIYINNLDVFDPTWFEFEGNASPKTLMTKLSAQMRHKKSKAIIQASKAYVEYLSLGGQILFATLSLELLKDYFFKKIPILTGLSATYLYRSSREYFKQGKSVYDDIRGSSCGHFVVLCGYDNKQKLIIVADPHRENPISHDNYYKVSPTRLINAILLGVFTYDANLLIIQPKSPEWKL